MPGSKLKAAYSIPELARMSGMSRGKIRRLLDSNGVHLGRQGRLYVVYLTAIKRGLPDLWDSILDLAAVRDVDDAY